MIVLIFAFLGFAFADPNAVAASEVMVQPAMQGPMPPQQGMNDNTIVTIISAVMSTVVGLVIATEKVTSYLGNRRAEQAPAAPPPAPAPAPAPAPSHAPFPPEISTKLSALEAKMENVEGRLDRLETTTRSIEQNDRDNTKSLARVEGRLTDWFDRFERVEKILLSHFNPRH